MSWYFWNPETDELTKAKYNILTSPKELWEPEHLALSECWHKNKRVAESLISGFWISTVFLGLDHSWGEGPPICFETMIFDHSMRKSTERSSWMEQYGNRYSSGNEARESHKRLDKLSRWLLLKSPQVSRNRYMKLIGQIQPQ